MLHSQRTLGRLHKDQRGIQLVPKGQDGGLHAKTLDALAVAQDQVPPVRALQGAAQAFSRGDLGQIDRDALTVEKRCDAKIRRFGVDAEDLLRFAHCEWTRRVRIQVE